MAATAARRSLLGMSLGVTAASVTASVLTWPLADLVLGPALIRRRALGRSAAAVPASPPSPRASAVVVRGGASPEERTAEARRLVRGRPALYVSLRESGTSHGAFVSLVDQVYGHAALTSVGLIWVLIFDAVSGDPGFVRVMHYAVVLRQLHRALRAEARPGQEGRPALVLDHVDGVGSPDLRRMLAQFACAQVYDHGCADVVVVEPESPRWLHIRQPPVRAEALTNSAACARVLTGDEG